MLKFLSRKKYALMAGTAMTLASGAALALPIGGEVCVVDPRVALCFDYFSFTFCCALFGL